MGKAFYRFKVSVAGSMIDGVSKDNLSSDKRECRRILTKLPRGTELISIEKDISQMTLAINCVAVFEHPIFIDDSEIKDIEERRRDFGISTDENSTFKNYTFDRDESLNWDDFVNKEVPEKEEIEYEIHVDGIKEIRK